MESLWPLYRPPDRMTEPPFPPPDQDNNPNQVDTNSIDEELLQTAPRSRKCNACLENVKKYVRFSCRHRYCPDCIETMIKFALEFKPFQPVKCCGVVPLEDFRDVKSVGAEEMKQYENMVEEATHPASTLYCWDKGCNQYIPVANRKRRTGQCDACQKKTCKSCRGKSHFGPCNPDVVQQVQDETSKVLQLGESKKWKLCPNCRQMIQKNGGCNHVT